jgi:hypothetical protein
MTRAITRDPIYRRRRFQSETIELCVRWYLTYRLSYRDLVEMMAERGIIISHSTILRWVQRYVPEFEKRWGLERSSVAAHRCLRSRPFARRPLRSRAWNSRIAFASASSHSAVADRAGFRLLSISGHMH